MKDFDFLFWARMTWSVGCFIYALASLANVISDLFNPSMHWLAIAMLIIIHVLAIGLSALLMLKDRILVFPDSWTISLQVFSIAFLKPAKLFLPSIALNLVAIYGHPPFP